MARESILDRSFVLVMVVAVSYGRGRFSTVFIILGSGGWAVDLETVTTQKGKSDGPV